MVMRTYPKQARPRRMRMAAMLTAALAVLGGTASAATPDLSGVWALAKPQVLLAPADGGTIPFTADGRKALEANQAAAAKGDYSFDPTMSTCASPGQPRLMLTPKPFAIFQEPSMLTILYQWNDVFRQIKLGKQLRDPLMSADAQDFPASQGYSAANWSGDTLVVTTTGLTDSRLLDNLLPSSSDLTLTEHLSLRDHDTLVDRITIADADDFTKPWDTVLTYQRQPDSLLPFPEDVCLDRVRAKQPALPR